MSDPVEFHTPQPADEPVAAQPVADTPTVKPAVTKPATPAPKGDKYKPYKLGR